MRFSKRRKAKIRKNRQKRVNRTCNRMIGCNVSADKDDARYYVVDQAKIDGMIYLLVEGEDGKFSIIKIVNVHLFVKLSPKRVLNKCQDFCNSSYWRDNSRIEISKEGIIDYVACRNQYDSRTFDRVNVFVKP